jgi:hypothetical protein
MNPMASSTTKSGLAIRLGVVIALLVYGLFAPPWSQTLRHFLTRRDPITWANYSRIEEGMAEADVQAVLRFWPCKTSPASEWPIPERTLATLSWVVMWKGADAHISVGFDEHARVRWKVFVQSFRD